MHYFSMKLLLGCVLLLLVNMIYTQVHGPMQAMLFCYHYVTASVPLLHSIYNSVIYVAISFPPLSLANSQQNKTT